MSSLDKTMHFDFNQNKGKNIRDTLEDVYKALEEKGYSRSTKSWVTCFRATQRTSHATTTPGT